MPQVRYVIDGGEPISIADAYVVGEFVSAEAGASFRWSTDGVEIRHELDYNATDAQASSAHVTLAIERSIVDPNQPEAVHRSLDPGNRATFGLALNPPVNLEAVTAEFQKTPTLVACSMARRLHSTMKKGSGRCLRTAPSWGRPAMTRHTSQLSTQAMPTAPKLRHFHSRSRRRHRRANRLSFPPRPKVATSQTEGSSETPGVIVGLVLPVRIQRWAPARRMTSPNPMPVGVPWWAPVGR